MYSVKNNQNLNFTGSAKTNPYGLIQHPYMSEQKGGKKRKSRKSRKSRRKTRKNKRR